MRHIESQESMGLIESYSNEKDGFDPFLIRDSWQVAKLSYSEELQVDHLRSFKLHQKSDRVFTLLKGNAVLIATDDIHKKSCSEVMLMQVGTSYNIPKNVWYAIAMQEGSEIFVVERANTHIEDATEYHLNEEQLQNMRSNINKAFKK